MVDKAPLIRRRGRPTANRLPLSAIRHPSFRHEHRASNPLFTASALFYVQLPYEGFLFKNNVDVFAVGLGRCSADYAAPRPRLIDSKATKETSALYHNLHRLASKHILFGHQHATEYGYGWSRDSGRSDVKSVTGSHPAVVGVDFSGLSGRPPEAIERTKELLRKQIADTYDRGGVTTVAWHFSNPVTPQTGLYWKDSVSAPAVPNLIPGRSHHEQYKAILRTISSLAGSVKGKDNKLAPMLFRPCHEFDRGWFWWGKPHCRREDFISLWRFTVSYLRDSLQVHNFIYAFSPECLYRTETEYLDRFRVMARRAYRIFCDFTKTRTHYLKPIYPDCIDERNGSYSEVGELIISLLCVFIYHQFVSKCKLRD